MRKVPTDVNEKQILSRKNIPENLYFIKTKCFKGREGRSDEESRPVGRGRERDTE